MYKEARKIENEKPSFVLNSLQIIKEYTSDAPQADSKFLNKTIEIKGNVTEVSDSTLTLDQKIFCKMSQKANSDLLNKKISIKGRCIGYDDLFEQVKFDQCSHSNN